jgi:hypothetical protein
MGQSFIWTCINQTTSWLVYSWITFDAQMKHGHTQTHNTHKTHLDLWIAFMFIVFMHQFVGDFQTMLVNCICAIICHTLGLAFVTHNDG